MGRVRTPPESTSKPWGTAYVVLYPRMTTRILMGRLLTQEEDRASAGEAAQVEVSGSTRH